VFIDENVSSRLRDKDRFPFYTYISARIA
jgi:hypothetical protein